MKTYANDQAFSRQAIYDPLTKGRGTSNGIVYEAIDGLSIREYFAAKAMQGLLAGHYNYFKGNEDVSVPSEIAKYAIYNADALIEELNKSIIK